MVRLNQVCSHVSAVAVVVERMVRLGEGEHVGVDVHAEVFQWHAKRPQAPITAGHRG
jgi:hypothetical protein